MKRNKKIKIFYNKLKCIFKENGKESLQFSKLENFNMNVSSSKNEWLGNDGFIVNDQMLIISLEKFNKRIKDIARIWNWKG